MLYAIVSDIHGNYSAWAAVLEDIRAIGVSRIICLGDVVGYGPEPGRCVQSIRDVAHACILGNHDAVVTKKLDSFAFNDHARKLIEWTELQLNPEEIDYLSELDYEYSEGCFRCVHGDCDAPNEFNYIVDCSDANLSWKKVPEQIIFCGHSHLPAIFVSTKNGSEMCSLPSQDFTLEDQNRYIVNVGSVGSPRDDDLRASYVLFDSDSKSVFFRRVGYDFNEFRERVRFVGLNESDVPLLCYVLEEEPAEHVALEEEISKSEIIVSNEASDLAKTVYLHQIDLSDILKNSKASNLGVTREVYNSGATKKQIIIKKHNTSLAENKQNRENLEKPNKATVLQHKPGIRINKTTTKVDGNKESSQSKKVSNNTKDGKYLRHVNAAERAPAKAFVFGAIFGLIILVFIGVLCFNIEAVNESELLRYPDKELEILNTENQNTEENLLPEIWMSAGNPSTIYPYRLTVSRDINVSYDNIDRMFGSELILHNSENSPLKFCFETPYVEVDPKGKYLVLAKIYLDEVEFYENISLQLVHANEGELYSVLPEEEVIKFYKKEISRKLYKKGNIPYCFKHRPSKAGWWLAKRTVEGKDLKQYMRVIIRGNFRGRMSIGGVSIQRLD